MICPLNDVKERMTMPKKYISDYAKEFDFIGDFEFEKEKKDIHGIDEAFILKAPTGYGKSHYITTEFYEYCKSKGYKILMLLPRSAPTEQFIKHTQNKKDVITVKTYQSITHKYITDGKYDLDYDYIICDECHYFVTDTLINTGTDICLDLICRSRAYKIYISATPEPLLEVIYEYYHSTYEIPIPPENTVIKAIDCFDAYSAKTTKATIIDIMENVTDKAIIFCNSANMAKKIYNMKQFKDNSLFICSEDNEKCSKYMNKDERDKMIEIGKFDCKYLICTSALDVGFSIEDEQVKDIICTFSPENWTTLIQSMGRKRQVNPQDKATLHIRNFTAAQIDNALEVNKRRFERLVYYREHGELEYLKKYRKRIDDKSNMIVTDYRLLDNGVIQLFIKEDKFVFGYYKYQEKILREIQKARSYAEYLKEKLQIADDVAIRHKKKDDYIDSRLKEIAAEGITYDFNTLDELTTKLNVRSKKRDLLKRPSAINKRLQEMGKPYMIEKTEDEQRHKHYKLIFIGQDE